MYLVEMTRMKMGIKTPAVALMKESNSKSEKGLRELTCINPNHVCGDSSRSALNTAVERGDGGDDGNEEPPSSKPVVTIFIILYSFSPDQELV